MLTEIGEPDIGPEADRPRIMVDLPGQDLEKSRLAGAVDSDYGDLVAPAEQELDIAENARAAVAFAHPLDPQDIAPRIRGGREGETDLLLLIGQFDQLQLVELLDPALDLSGLGGLGPKPFDEPHGLFDLRLLIVVGAFFDGPPLRFFLYIEAVVALIDLDPAEAEGPGHFRGLGAKNPIVEVIIKDHLKDLELKNYVHIARKLKVPIREVEIAVLLISNMEPRPGSMYSEEKVQSIIPDVYVVKSGDEYKIILNDDGMPRLRISNFYREVMAGVGGHGDHNEEENGKKYIREKVQSATWLIKSIQQRQKTIYKVAESIVKFQRDFFDRGINFLKPLILRDVADDVEMHESTISRVVTNKYMHTPRGIFEMKYFFGSSIQRTSGENIASKSVKEEIKNLVGKEDPKKPYSDCEIVDLLKQKGINIARRTVAKYREMMGILPSSKRKKYF